MATLKNLSIRGSFLPGYDNIETTNHDAGAWSANFTFLAGWAKLANN
jgi:hypothetical protein